MLISAKDYEEFRQGHRPDIEHSTKKLFVDACYRVPHDVTELPNHPTVFTHGIQSMYSKLNHFNHGVFATADFTNSALETIGPNANFEAIDLSHTPIATFNHTADTLSLSDVANFKGFGTATRVQTLRITTEILRFLPELKKLPERVVFPRFEKPAGIGDPPLEGLIQLAPYFLAFEGQEDVSTILDYARLRTQSPRNNLEHYSQLAALPNRFREFINKIVLEGQIGPEQRKTDDIITKFLKDLETNLRDLAILKISNSRTKSRPNNHG